jgi:hypothetical protein
MYAVGSGKVLIFKDGEWSEVDRSFDHDIYDVWCSSENDVFVVGGNTIYHFDGSAWSVDRIFDDAEVKLNAVWGSGGSGPFVAGGKGKSTDTSSRRAYFIAFDGSEWIEIETPFEFHLYKLWGTSPEKVYIVGGGYLHSYDGSNWLEIEIDSTVARWTPSGGIWGSSEDDIYIVGSEYIHYNGSIWRSIPGTPTTARGVWGSGPDDVYIVGDSGSAAHFDGNEWKAVSHASEKRFWDVWVHPNGGAFAVYQESECDNHGGGCWDWGGVLEFTCRE